MLSQYLTLCGASVTAPLPLQFFMERAISVQEWLDRGWLNVSPVGDNTFCRYCGDIVPIHLKRTQNGNVLTARCRRCGSYELTQGEALHYGISAAPVIEAIRAGLNCRGTVQQDTPLPFLGHAAITGQSRSVYFLPAIRGDNVNAVQSLLATNKLNLLFFCIDATDHSLTAQMSARQMFPLDTLLSTDQNGTIAMDREQVLLRLQPDQAPAPRKSPKTTSAVVVCAEKMKKELDAYFKDVYRSRCHAASVGMPPAEFPKMTQGYLARIAGTYPAMACRAIQRDPALRLMFKHANDLDYICGYLGVRGPHFP